MVSKYSSRPIHHGEQEEHQQYQTQQQVSSSVTSVVNGIGSTCNRSTAIAIRGERCDWDPIEKAILYNEQRYTHATWMMYSRIAEYRERNQVMIYDTTGVPEGAIGSNENVVSCSDDDFDEEQEEVYDEQIEEQERTTGKFPLHLPVSKFPLYHQQQQQSLASMLTDIVTTNDDELLDYEIFDLDL